MVKKNWKIFLTKLENNRGSVLLTTYMLTMVLLILGTAFLVLSSNEARISEVHRKTTQAFYIAEAGIERAIFDLKTDFANSKDWTDSNINGWIVDKTDTDADGYYPLPDTSDVANAAYLTTALGDGSYSVRLMNGVGTDDIYIRSIGTIGSISQAIQIYVTVVNLSPWDNAIFGGSGSAGNMVSGNVKVAGSVHILGGEDLNGNDILDSGEDKNNNGILDGLSVGENAIDLGGTAELVKNNYGGLEAALEAKVPALPTVVLGADTVETLGAELRVRKGLVGLSGSSAVGEVDDPGDTDNEKETVDGAYVTDGYNGNSGAGNVHSDNGTSEAYDLGDAVSFPTLNDDIGIYNDYYDYFDAEAYTLAAGEMATLANLTSATPDFVYSTTGDCTGANCISMTSGELYIQGKVYINGGTLGISGGTIEYTGTGTILVTGNVAINEDLMTVGNASFPNNIIAIMTPGNIEIGTGAGAAQLDVMGLFYAEGTITTAKQTDVMGSLATNYFNISNQVPSVWQVPETINNLPGGLIGGDDVYLMNVVSWQKI